MPDKPEPAAADKPMPHWQIVFYTTIFPRLKIAAPPILVALAVFLLLLVTGLEDLISNDLAAFTGPVPPALIVFVICFIPAVSPLMGTGLVIATVAAVLVGEQIAEGVATLFLALPALLAIDAQIGGRFIPPGLSMGKSEPETINAGVPRIVFTRLITIPAAVALAFLFTYVV
jgi:PTS system glucitol/sorbitol-specific IIC component